MKYCQQCGAQLPDEANFCRSCGAKMAPKVSARTSDDGEGIVIDAPEDATVTISDGPKGTKAPDSSGEFFIASWGGTEAKQTQKVKEPEEVNEPEEPSGKNNGIFSIIMTFIKVMLLVLSIVFTAVIIRGFFVSDPPEAPEQEQMMLPNSLGTGNHSEDDDLVFESIEVPESEEASDSKEASEIKEDPESNSGFGKIEDMPLSERAEYIQGLLERTEQYLQEEQAKGAAANQAEIRQLRKDIDMLRKALAEIKQ